MAEPSYVWPDGSRPSVSSPPAPVGSEPIARAATPTPEPTVNHQPPPPPLPPAREASPQPISARPVRPISARSTGGRCPAVGRETHRVEPRRIVEIIPQKCLQLFREMIYGTLLFNNRTTDLRASKNTGHTERS
ncbi:classical arabinogalactan protein 9-like [Ursus maritimus]|uniref:Classical arabinogalactan protein 9-like n=1 Tax=Ursus maritimus TaxID=29073 RepID=A0A8M1H3G0_URSMA|nr:classical arabinogalactan protein 9-like [Ursus maritimus]